jgi:hypothetical protein
MGPEPRELHCILGRIVIRRGRNGLPESHREVECCKERHAEWFVKNGGWEVLIRESEMPIGPHDIEPAQRNENRSGDTGDD